MTSATSKGNSINNVRPDNSASESVREIAGNEMSKQWPPDGSEIFDKFRKTGCFKYLTSPILAASRCGDYYGAHTNYYDTSQEFISPSRYQSIKHKPKYHKCAVCDEVRRNLWAATGKSCILIPDIAAQWFADQRKLKKLLTDIKKLTPKEALLYRQYLCQNQSLFSSPPLECLNIKPPLRTWINVDEEESTNYMSPEFLELLRKHNESMNQLYNLNAQSPKYRSRKPKRIEEPLRPASSLGVTPQKFYYDEERRNVAKESKKTVSEPVLYTKKITAKPMPKPRLREIWKKTDGLAMRDSETSVPRHRKEIDASTATGKEVSQPLQPTFLKKKVRKREGEQRYPLLLRKNNRVHLGMKRRHSERKQQPFFNRRKVKKALRTNWNRRGMPRGQLPIAGKNKKDLQDKPRTDDDQKHLISKFQPRKGKEDLGYSDKDKKDLKKESDEKEFYSDEDQKNLKKDLDAGDHRKDSAKELQTEDKKDLKKGMHPTEHEGEDKKDLIKKLRDDKKDLKNESDEHRKELTKEEHVVEEKKVLTKEQSAVKAKQDMKEEPHVSAVEKKLTGEPRTGEDKQDSTKKSKPDEYKKKFFTSKHSLIPKRRDSALLEFETFSKVPKEKRKEGMHFDKYDKRRRIGKGQKDMKKGMSSEEWKRDLRKKMHTAQHKEDLKKNFKTDDREEDLRTEPHKQGLKRYHTAPKQFSTKKRDDLDLPELEQYINILLNTVDQDDDFKTQPGISQLAEKRRPGKRKTYPRKKLHTDTHKEDIRKELPSGGRIYIPRESVIEPAKPAQKLEEKLRTDKYKKDLPYGGRIFTLKESSLPPAKSEQNLKKKLRPDKYKKKLKRTRYAPEEEEKKINGTKNDEDLESEMLKASFIRNQASMYLRREMPSIEHKEDLRKDSLTAEYKEPPADDHEEELKKEPPGHDHKEELRKESLTDQHKEELEEESPADDFNEKLKEESLSEEYEQELKKETPADDGKEELERESLTVEHKEDLNRESSIYSLREKAYYSRLIPHKYKIDLKKRCALKKRRHQKDLKIVGDETLISSGTISPRQSLHECQRPFYMINDFGQRIEKFGIKSSRRSKRFLRPADACPWPMICPKVKAVQRDARYRESVIRYQKAAQRVKLDLEEAARIGFLTWTSLKCMDFDCKNYENVPTCNVRPQTIV
ncbi:hypothetical protein GQX74_007266 [Glossina fuscipes]|nr:hypothetical protein GQX74_007266 [Glossina fuscipes]